MSDLDFLLGVMLYINNLLNHCKAFLNYQVSEFECAAVIWEINSSTETAIKKKKKYKLSLFILPLGTLVMIMNSQD